MESYIIQNIHTGKYLHVSEWDLTQHNWYDSGEDAKEFDTIDEAKEFYDEFYANKIKVTFVKIYYRY